jgi:hypothetical protein
MHDDWQIERAVAAIRSAAEVPGNPAVADALAAAVDRRKAQRVVARKRKEAETEAAYRQEEDALVSLLEVELRALMRDRPRYGPTHRGGIHHTRSHPPSCSLQTLLRRRSEHQRHGSRRPPGLQDRFIGSR